MGKIFGNLAKITGVTSFALSPHEQKAFVGIISEGFPNLVRRFNESVLRVTPFFLGIYLLPAWANEEYHRLHRKNPKDYENDT